MTMSKKIILLVSVLILVIVFIVVTLMPSKPGKYDEFAKCLGEKGAKFYGTFWCPHCADQKSLFEKSVKYLPYVECSDPTGSSQLNVCKENNIVGYPTWTFADGSRQEGLLTLSELSEKTSCPLPN